MEVIVLFACLRQLMKVGDISKGKGNCSICVADEENRKCSSYIKFNIFQVEQKMYNAEQKKKTSIPVSRDADF